MLEGGTVCTPSDDSWCACSVGTMLNGLCMIDKTPVRPMNYDQHAEHVLAAACDSHVPPICFTLRLAAVLLPFLPLSEVTCYSCFSKLTLAHTACPRSLGGQQQRRAYAAVASSAKQVVHFDPQSGTTRFLKLCCAYSSGRVMLSAAPAAIPNAPPPESRMQSRTTGAAAENDMLRSVAVRLLSREICREVGAKVRSAVPLRYTRQRTSDKRNHQLDVRRPSCLPR